MPLLNIAYLAITIFFGSLEASWKVITMKKVLAIVFSCFAFALAMGLVACGGSASSNAASASADSTASASASSSSDAEAKAEYDRACTLFDEGKYYSAKEAFEKSQYGDWEQRAAACIQPMPETGELYHADNMTSDNMILTFSVNEDNANKGMYITVYTKDKVLVESLFIKGAGAIDTNLPGGEYYVKDSTGTEWYGEDEQFGPDGHYESMVFDEVEGDRYLTALEEGYVWTITINTVSNDGQGVGSEENTWDNRK